MSIANDILAEIISKLGSIDGISVLDGYLVHYANDLLSGDNGATFPCVAVQLDSEIVQADNNKRLKLTRTYKVIGAVDAFDQTLVNQKLNNLLKSIRVALYSNAYEPEESLASNMSLSNAQFKLPDSSDVYALFEVDLTVDYIDTLI